VDAGDLGGGEIARDRRRDLGTCLKRWQNFVIPAMTDSRSGAAPDGWTGLQLISTPRTTSAAVTCRGGEVSQRARGRIVTV
jgi:hypothetical protein